jgi:hypothetical protein
MNRKILRLALCPLLFALSFPAEAQQPTKVARVGFLALSAAVTQGRREAFLQGLRELGYTKRTKYCR